MITTWRPTPYWEGANFIEGDNRNDDEEEEFVSLDYKDGRFRIRLNTVISAGTHALCFQPKQDLGDDPVDVIRSLEFQLATVTAERDILQKQLHNTQQAMIQTPPHNSVVARDIRVLYHYLHNTLAVLAKRDAQAEVALKGLRRLHAWIEPIPEEA